VNPSVRYLRFSWNEGAFKVIFALVIVFIIRAQTGKPIGSKYVTEFEPTALVVGA
jgi:hypothetical protein